MGSAMKLSNQMTDGLLYFFAAIFTASQAAFGADEAYKYVNPYLLFWIRTVSGILGAGVLAVKMYRSGRYPHEQQKEKIMDVTVCSDCKKRVLNDGIWKVIGPDVYQAFIENRFYLITWKLCGGCQISHIMELDK